MSNERGMSPAEFKTAHEALGVSTAFLADRIGVSSGRIWAYESAERSLPVPDRAADIVRELQHAFDKTARSIAAASGEAGVIERLADSAEFELRWPDMLGWGQLAQGLVIARAQAIAQLPVEYA